MISKVSNHFPQKIETSFPGKKGDIKSADFQGIKYENYIILFPTILSGRSFSLFYLNLDTFEWNYSPFESSFQQRTSGYTLTADQNGIVIYGGATASPQATNFARVNIVQDDEGKYITRF